MTLIDNFIYMLTWTSKKVLVFDFSNQTIDEPEIREYPFAEMKQGWGISHSDKTKSLYVSDGTSSIF